jgi:hypothetical protein
MKSIKYAILAFSLTSSALLGDQNISHWSEVVRDAAQQEKLVITSLHTGHFGGVFTSTYDISLGQNKEGDAASILFDASSKKFHDWASKVGAEHSTTNSLGGRSLRIKTANGNYLSTVYQPPKAGGTQGTFTVIFVDADKFIQDSNPKPNKPAEQGGGGQPATRTVSKYNP